MRKPKSRPFEKIKTPNGKSAHTYHREIGKADASAKGPPKPLIKINTCDDNYKSRIKARRFIGNGVLKSIKQKIRQLSKPQREKRAYIKGKFAA
ncbi:MAG: hypothetical protein D6722_01265 [Bacteroidetes bacterium]|nr:MAG: hypothetical protein D6722_01265 [Bacteroidota bacterium]